MPIKEGEYCKSQCMKMKYLNRRVTAFIMAVICAGGMIMPQHSGNVQIVESATLAELDAQKQANNKKIQQYEQELAKFDAAQKEERAYQQTLQKKIDTLQENMQILDTELNHIKDEIFGLEIEIFDLEAVIAQQEIDIAEGLEQFKLRLRAMYVNGNDSLASALVGATDFYDLLSKYELISCVARHDDELVNSLKAQLESYNANLETLNTQMASLEQAKADAEAKRDEMEAAMADLEASIAETQAELERLQIEEANRNKSIAELQAENKRIEDTEEQIREEIRRAEEEARKKEEERKRKEEEERKRREEEERKRQEEAAKREEAKKEEESSSGGGSSSGGESSSGGGSYVQPDYSSTSFGWPCPGHYYISSRYGWRWGKLHKGYDIAQNKGAAVAASRAGTVISVNTSCSHNYAKQSNCCGNGYGNYVIVSHGDGYTTMYAHMQTVSVSVGQSVGKGSTLGYVGCTGHSTGFHLHFEIRKNGVAVDPSGYLNY